MSDDDDYTDEFIYKGDPEHGVVPCLRRTPDGEVEMADAETSPCGTE